MICSACSEPLSGGARFGGSFDDWGNRFLCNIRNPVQHVVLPLHYMQRNPNLIVPSFINDCAESGDQLRVFRISPPEAWREFRALVAARADFAIQPIGVREAIASLFDFEWINKNFFFGLQRRAWQQGSKD